MNTISISTIIGTRRHSLRRAISSLVAEGRITIRQGKGTFVSAAPPIDYQISKRTRASANLAAFGAETEGRILGVTPQHCSPEHAKKLHLPPGAPLIKSQSKRCVCGVPLSLSTTYVSQDRFPDWAELLNSLASHTAILRHYHFTDYHRFETVIFARPARHEETALLELPPRAWVMVTQKLDISPEGLPLIWGESIWAADRIQFTITDERTFS